MLTISDVKELNREAGFHFFDRSTVRFFKSRIESRLSKRNRFITSEQSPWGKRTYSVRQYCSDTHKIETLFRDLPSKDIASDYMRYHENPIEPLVPSESRFPVTARCA